jgi:hypothetical protein
MEIFWCISDSKSVSALSSVFGASLIPNQFLRYHLLSLLLGNILTLIIDVYRSSNVFYLLNLTLSVSLFTMEWMWMNIQLRSPPPFLFWWTVAWRKAIVVEIYQREVDFSLCFKCERHISGGSCIWLVTLQLTRYVFFYAFVNNLLASWRAVVEGKAGQG